MKKYYNNFKEIYSKDIKKELYVLIGITGVISGVLILFFNKISGLALLLLIYSISFILKQKDSYILILIKKPFVFIFVRIISPVLKFVSKILVEIFSFIFKILGKIFTPIFKLLFEIIELVIDIVTSDLFKTILIWFLSIFIIQYLYNFIFNNKSESNYDYIKTSSYGSYKNKECNPPENPYSDGSGHYAGFQWGENGNSCGGNSNSFIEGCEEYEIQEENYSACLNN